MSTTAQQLFRAAARRKLTIIRARGFRMRVGPRDRLASDFAEILRAHKAELLQFLCRRSRERILSVPRLPQRPHGWRRRVQLVPSFFQ